MDIKDFVIGSEFRDAPEKYLTEIKELRGNRRVWFVFSHFFAENGANERTIIMSGLNKIGTLIDRYQAPQASIFLYDLY